MRIARTGDVDKERRSDRVRENMCDNVTFYLMGSSVLTIELGLHCHLL